MTSREQRLPSESGERFLGENDYRETIDRLEALLREATEELEKDAWSVMDKDRVYRFHAILAESAPPPQITLSSGAELVNIQRPTAVAAPSVHTALVNLVRLKDLKEWIERGTATPEATAQYEYEKEPAWEAARLALEAAPEEAPREGWKLVPVEPYYDQVLAGLEKLRGENENPSLDSKVARIYTAMLAAAPEYASNAAPRSEGTSDHSEAAQGRAAELFAGLQEELSDMATQKTMLVGQCAELVTSLQSCEKQLVTCAHAYRAADNFDEAQRCSDTAFTARLILKKWEEL